MVKQLVHQLQSTLGCQGSKKAWPEVEAKDLGFGVQGTLGPKVVCFQRGR